jgi:hypothetical protein
MWNWIVGFLQCVQHSSTQFIHFENKVMKHQDRKQPLASGENRMQITADALTEAGYQLYEEGEDTLAFFIPAQERSVSQMK